ncbi:MAG TPA: trigger factor [Dissulfurispiraceae bacterium]|nr:trigger factor [Dissulfurispiraceae bacterium]
MLKSVEDLSATKKRLTIEIPADVIEAEIQKGFTEAQKLARIPGFRPGKIPASMIEKKYGKGIENDVLEKLVPEYYGKALEEAGLKPVARPEMESGITLVRSVPVTMQLTVEVRPKVEPLVYEGIAVKDVPVVVTDEEVDGVMKNAAEEKGSYEPVDAPVQTGDLLTVDYAVEGDETPAKDTLIKVGAGPYPPVFFDALVGRRKGDIIDIEVEFPDTIPSSFAGKTPKFHLTIKEMKRKGVLPIDDELAKDLGFETLHAAKDKVRENLEAEKTFDAERKQQLEIVEKLVASHECQVPEGLIKADLERMLGEAQARGTFEGTPEEFEQQNRDKAVKAVKASILLEIIGEKENVQVSEDEMKNAIFGFAARFNISPENVVKYYTSRDGSLAGLRNGIFEKKTLKLLLEKATIEKGV